jgi:hypothetical protein
MASAPFVVRAGDGIVADAVGVHAQRVDEFGFDHP